MFKGEIYKVTCLVTGKTYVGQTAIGYINRFQEHLRDARNSVTTMPFHNAIRLFGEHNFFVELLATAQNAEDLNRLEAEFILSTKSLVRENGYNVLCYSDTHPHRLPDTILFQIFPLAAAGVPQTEICERLGIGSSVVYETLKGKSRPHLRELWESENLPLLEDFRKKISDELLWQCFELRAQGRTVESLEKKFNVPWLSLVFSGRFRPALLAKWKAQGGVDFKKLSAKQQATRNRAKAQVVLASDGNRFSTLPEASDYYGVSVQAIYKCIKYQNPLQTTGTPIYFSYEGKSKRRESRKTPVKLIAEDGTYKLYPSLRALAEDYGVLPCNAERAFKNKTKFLGKYDLHASEAPNVYVVKKDGYRKEFETFRAIAEEFKVHFNTPEKTFREGGKLLGEYVIEKL